MPWHDIGVAMVPAVSILMTVVGHLLLSRVFPSRLPWWSLVWSALAGVVFAIGSTVWLLRGADGADLVAYLMLNVAGATALAFGYFCFVTLNYTSLRVRMLRELQDNGGSISIETLKTRYSSDGALDLRLARLVTAGELTTDGHSYRLGPSRKFLFIGRVFGFFRSILGMTVKSNVTPL